MEAKGVVVHLGAIRAFGISGRQGGAAHARTRLWRLEFPWQLAVTDCRNRST